MQDVQRNIRSVLERSMPHGYNVLTSDFENTTWNTGSPFDPRNFSVCVGYKHNDGDTWCEFEPPPERVSYSLYVFFNAKYDLHWYRRNGVDITGWNIWCCQIAEFLLSGQKERFPSLENTSVKYSLGHKIDVIKEEYWGKGINTDAIPHEVLEEYCKQDVELTYKVYQQQLKQFQERPALFKLFKLMMQDLLVLQEMEWNGLMYDDKLCQQREEELTQQIEQITSTLTQVYPDIVINFNSGDQLSAFLYGGNIKLESKEHIGFYKTGEKVGLPKYKNVETYIPLPRLVEPLKGTELKKEGVWSTDEDTLRKLKGPNAKKYVAPLLKLAELHKLVSTYYRGLREKNEEGHWPKQMIHGQFNQCVAQTGRLSSSKPNLQNFAGDSLDIFISRFST